MENADYNDSVFINCPFDESYKRMFDAIVFAVFDCGFRARCTLEEEDASQIRIEKIYSIVSDCRYGIHDISSTDLDPTSNLPRFNMPLELGIFLSAKRFGTKNHRRKKCLVLDSKKYRYQRFISDISGQDVKAHENNPEKVVKIVRDWLRNASRRITMPGGTTIWRHYKAFVDNLPEMCNQCRLDVNELIFNDYAWLVVEWLKALDKPH